MQKKILATAAVFCILAVFTACSPLTFQNAGDLLRAPELGQGYGEIQKALTAFLGEKPQYKFPKEGSWRQPIRMADLNGDGKDEAILLYSMPASAVGLQGKGSKVSVAILEYKEGAWQVTEDIEGDGTDIASLDVADLLSTGTRQLIVGYSSSGSVKTFALYTYAQETLTNEIARPYSSYALGDFTGRGGTDLVWVSPDDTSDSLGLIYLPMLDGQFQSPQAPVKLDSNIKSCVGIYPSAGSDGVPVMIVDGEHENGMLSSQILYYTEAQQQFIRVEEPLKQAGTLGRLNPLLKSKDIDGDGIVEIPLRVGKYEIATIQGDKHLEYVEWIDFTAETPVTKQFGLLDSDRRVFVCLPDEWRGNITVVDGAGEGEWSVEDARTKETLLSLLVLEAEETPSVRSIQVPGAASAYLTFRTGLTAVQRDSIQMTSLM